jgi:hypothetical protein
MVSRILDLHGALVFSFYCMEHLALTCELNCCGRPLSVTLVMPCGGGVGLD